MEEPVNPSMNSATSNSTTVPLLQHPSATSNSTTVPLLQHPSHCRPKSSIIDELRNFRIILKWCALDHSTCIGKSLSYLVFFLLAIVVPVISSVFVKVPKTAYVEDPISFNKLVQLPESGLAGIAFFTLSCFFRRYRLRHLLFLDGLQDDSMFVRHGYARELDKSFKHLFYILLPSFFVELPHKILFFSTVKVSVPYVKDSVPLNSILFIAVLASWVYRTGVFLLVCALFRLTCELQILRFEGFKKLLEECGSDSGIVFLEHMRIRKQLSVTSHRYRFFIVVCLFTITISQFGVMMLMLGSKSEKNFFNSGDLVVCSAVQLSGFLLSLLGAARITHRAQGIVSIATRWHMLATCGSYTGFDSNTVKDLIPVAPPIENTVDHHSKCDVVDDLDSSDTCITIPSQDNTSFHTRQALVTYLQHNNGGITVYGFALDRGLLHTLFAFEFSLVLWILSKVVVLS